MNRFPLKAIESDPEFQRAAAIVDELAVSGEGDLDRGEHVYLNALAVLMDAYDFSRLRLLQDDMKSALPARRV